jgi:McbB family protein
MFFYLKQFRIFDLQNISILYSTNSSIIIKDHKINKFLKFLETFSGKVISAENFSGKLCDLSLDKKKTLLYFQEHLKLLTTCSDPSQGNIDSILISSTHLFFKTLLLQELKGILPVPVLNIEDDQAKTHSSPLILSFFDNFYSDQIKKTYDSFIDKQSSFITSYVIHRTLIIDGIFIPFKGTPCHFCFFNRWKNLEKNQKQISETSWFNYFQYVSTLKEKVPISLPLEQSDIGVLVATIKKKLRWLVIGEVLPTLYDPRSFTRYHLDEGTWDHDVIPHWPGCECITDSWL